MVQVRRREPKSLKHAEEGSTWKKHKYIRIENGRYIYPEDLAKTDKTQSTTTNVARVKTDTTDTRLQSTGVVDTYRNVRALRETYSADSPQVQDAVRAHIATEVSNNYDKNKSEKMEARIMKKTGCSSDDVKALNEIAVKKGLTSKAYAEKCNELAKGDHETYRKVTSAMKNQIMAEACGLNDEGVNNLKKIIEESGGDFEKVKKKASKTMDVTDEGIRFAMTVNDVPPMHPDVKKRRMTKKEKQLRKAQVELYGKKIAKKMAKARKAGETYEPERKPTDNRGESRTAATTKKTSTKPATTPGSATKINNGKSNISKVKTSKADTARTDRASKRTSPGSSTVTNSGKSNISKMKKPSKADSTRSDHGDRRTPEQRANAARNTINRTISDAGNKIKKATKNKASRIVERASRNTAESITNAAKVATNAKKKIKPRTMTIDDLISIFSGRG